jgi:hypothetical protein
MKFYSEIGISAKAGRVFLAAEPGADAIWLDAPLARSLNIAVTLVTDKVAETKTLPGMMATLPTNLNALSPVKGVTSSPTGPTISPKPLLPVKVPLLTVRAASKPDPTIETAPPSEAKPEVPIDADALKQKPLATTIPAEEPIATTMDQPKTADPTATVASSCKSKPMTIGEMITGLCHIEH